MILHPNPYPQIPATSNVTHEAADIRDRDWPTRSVRSYSCILNQRGAIA